MPANILLSNDTRNDIEVSVRKILRDLDFPEPPLRLEDVRELLQLDRAYYSSSDEGVLTETIHRLRIAGKQVLQKPSRLLDVVRTRDLKALWLPDRRRILIDSDLPKPKHRWAEAHEIGHSIIEWHGTMTHGDQHQTLSYACQQQLEAEANFGAGQLLFLQDKFADIVKSGPVTLDRIRSEIAKTFGNTITATLWRVVETLETPCFGMVSCSPHENAPASTRKVRYFIRSQRFAHEFSNTTSSQLFSRLKEFCRHGRGPLGESDIVVTDDRGEEHLFRVAAFNNSHDTLSFGNYIRPAPIQSAVAF